MVLQNRALIHPFYRVVLQRWIGVDTLLLNETFRKVLASSTACSSIDVYSFAWIRIHM